jgi:hypothetical protein
MSVFPEILRKCIGGREDGKGPGAGERNEG